MRLASPRAPLDPPPLVQPARSAGYRVNVDAYRLATFAGGAARAARRTFDLGAGVGPIAIALLDAGATARAVLVEADDEAARFAQENVLARGHAPHAEIVHGDVLEVAATRRGEADLVVCNPPYFEPGRGRAPREPRRARARTGSLEHFVDAARHVAGRRARVCFVYPAREALALLAALRARGLEPKRLRAVHARGNAAARIVLVEALPAKTGGLTVEPPLFEDQLQIAPAR